MAKKQGRSQSGKTRRSSASQSVARIRPRDPVPRGLAARIRHHATRFPFRLVFFGVVPIGGLFGYLLVSFLFRSDYFLATNWRVYGEDRLGREDIRSLALGEYASEPPNLFSFSTKKAEDLIARHPAVYHVRVRKAFPDTVEVLLEEREAEALLVTASGSYLVDLDGRVFSPASNSEILDPALPVLTVSGNQTFEVGDTLPIAFSGPALLYAGTFEQLEGPLAGALSEIHWEPGTGLTLYLESGTRLVCGNLPPHETLPKYEALLGKRAASEIESADLRLDNDLPWMPTWPSGAVAQR